MSNMEFDHKPFPESSFESAFTYMDSGLDYFQYPPSPIGVNVGCEYSNPGICNHYLTKQSVPQPVAPSMDLHTLNSISDYAYASSSFAPSPPNAFTSQDEEASGVAPQALFYGLSGGELSDGLPSGRVSRGSGSRSPAAAPYAAVPRSQRFNPIAVPASRPSTRAQVAASHRRTKSARSNDIDSDDDDDEEFKPTTGSPAEAGDNIPRDS